MAFKENEFVDLGSSKYRKEAEDENFSATLNLCKINGEEKFEDKWFGFLTSSNS